MEETIRGDRTTEVNIIASDNTIRVTRIEHWHSRYSSEWEEYPIRSDSDERVLSLPNMDELPFLTALEVSSIAHNKRFILNTDHSSAD